MSDNGLLESRIKDLIKDNLDQFIDPAEDCLDTISVDNICRQNQYSKRIGGKCVIEYYDRNKCSKKTEVWIKKIKRPEKFYNEMSFRYSSLEKHGLHNPVTKPYLYDNDSGIVCISTVNGLSLMKKALKSAFIFSFKNSRKLHNLFYDVGKWLQQYHRVMIADTTIPMTTVLSQLAAVLKNDSFFSNNQKQHILKHLHRIQKSDLAKLNLPMTRTHNDLSLKNILVSNSCFGVIDWDAMVHPRHPQTAPIWNEISFFLINLQSLLRFSPLTLKRKIKNMKQSFLQGYFENNNVANIDHFKDLFYIFTLRYFVGIDYDRTLPQNYRRNFGSSYIKLLAKNLVRGNADITC